MIDRPESGTNQPGLFSPGTLGRLALANRLVMAPMTRSRAEPGGLPSTMAPTYYAQRASAGLIISEAAHVSPEGMGYAGTPGIHTSAHVARWRSVTQAVHASGGRIYLQIWHVGRISHPCMQPEGRLPVAPSAIPAKGQLFTDRGRQDFVTPRALELREIPILVEQFAHAARLSKVAGFDGVDIHAANGYLIDQFLRDGSNQRRDAYGGSVSNRARFLLEVVEAVASVWGAEQTGVRVSPLSSYNCMHDSDPAATFGYVATALSRLGVGYLHVSEPCPGHPMARTEGRQLVVELRRAVAGHLIVDGGRDRETAELWMAEAGADLVALATPFIANPDLVERLADGLPLCPADPSTFYSGGPRGYIDYPMYDRAAHSRMCHTISST